MVAQSFVEERLSIEVFMSSCHVERRLRFSICMAHPYKLNGSRLISVLER